MHIPFAPGKGDSAARGLRIIVREGATQVANAWPARIREVKIAHMDTRLFRRGVGSGAKRALCVPSTNEQHGRAHRRTYITLLG